MKANGGTWYESTNLEIEGSRSFSFVDVGAMGDFKQGIELDKKLTVSS